VGISDLGVDGVFGVDLVGTIVDGSEGNLNRGGSTVLFVSVLISGVLGVFGVTFGSC